MYVCMYVYMLYTCIQTYKHTNIQTYKHTYIHTYTYIYQYIQSYIHTYRAGELISTVAVAIQNRLHVRELSLTIQPSSSYAYALHKVWVEAATRKMYANLQNNPLAALSALLYSIRRAIISR